MFSFQMRLFKGLRKLFSIIATFAVLFNSVAPYSVAIAQEITPDPTPTDTAAPTAEPTVTPSDTPLDVTPSPEVTVTPSDNPDVTPTDAPVVTQAPESNPTTTSPPAENNQATQPTNSPISTPVVYSEPIKEGTVSTTVVENIDLSNITLLNSNVDPIPTVTTDQPDYSPTSMALITGTGFKPSYTYGLEVTSTDEPPVDFKTDVTTDEKGTFSYGYQLDGNYRPNYVVKVFNGSVLVTETTFTDSATVIAATGGTAISAGTVGGTYTILTGPTITEGANQDFGLGTLILNVPSGFIFNVGQNVTATITRDNGSKNCFTFTSNTATPTTTTITFTINAQDQTTGGANTTCHVTFSNIQVRPTSITPLASGNITKSGTATITGVTASTNLGTLTEVASATPTPTASPTATPTATPTPVGPIVAQNIACMGDQPTAPSGLNCTANDIQIASVDNLHIVASGPDAAHLSPSSQTQCDYPGQYIQFTADWHVLSTASQRYNVGLWFAAAGQTSALHGNCSASTLPNAGGPFFESTNDSCGDINSGSTGTVSPAILVTAQCLAAPGTNQLSLPYCTSWDNNEAAGNACNGPAGTVPGTPSKCSCNSGFTVPIIVPPSIEVTKVVSPSNDTGKFNLQVNSVTKATDVGNGGTTGKIGVTPGSNTFGEIAGTNTDLNNYASVASCVLRGTQTSVTATKNGSTWTIANVANGQDILCTITNTIQNGTLTVQKTTIPAADPTVFSINATGSGTITGGGAGTVTDSTDKVYTVIAGTYSVSETVPTGWAQTGNTCTNVVVTPGQNTNCLITNTKLPKLTVHKVVINHGLTNDTSHFTPYKVDTTTVALDQANTFSVGNHTVTEANDANYTATFSGACDSNGNVTLAAGDDKTCTITNEEKLAHLTVTKTVINHGGNATTATFAPYKVDTTTVTLGVSNVFNSGNHNVTETTNSNYTQTFSGDCNVSGQVTLNSGDNKTCAITNEEKPAKLIVHKVVVNHGLTNDATHFAPYKVDTTTVTLDTENTFDSGNHTVTEGSDANYTATFSGDCDSNGNVTLSAGTTKTCTITNEEKAASIVVHKIVINHGLSNDSTHFAPYKVGATTVTLDSVTPINSGTYTVSENADSNYNATFSGDCNPQGSVTVTSGSAKSCTITNEEKLAHLTLVKTITNNDGGNNQASEWTLNATGPTPISGATESQNVTNATVNSGTYTLSETNGPSGYIGSAWECVGGTQNGSSITLTSGQSATCTINNNDIPATIQLTKVVNELYGGTAGVNDFGLSIGNTGVTSGQVLSVNSNTSYALNEEGLTGYEFVSLTGDELCPKVLGGTVTLNEGQNISCTITNKDIQPQLTVIKHVVNDSGGEAVAGDFTMNVTGTNVSDTSFPGDEAGTTVTLNAGSYSVDEDSFAGYTKSIGTDCSGTIAVGEHKTCTITNDDDPGTLTIVKNTVGGDGKFDFTVNGPTASSPELVTDKGTAKTSAITVNAGTYSVVEGAQTGWDLTGANCGRDISPNSFKIANGQDVTCTFTNTKRGNVIVTKYQDNNANGTQDEGEPVLADWTINLSDNGSQNTNANGVATFNNVLPGSLTLSETMPDNTWIQSNISCDNGDYNSDNKNFSLTVDPGQTVNCKIGNYQNAKVTVTKDVVNPDGDPVVDTSTGFVFGMSDQDPFTLYDGDSKEFSVKPGSYHVGETTNENYDFEGCTNLNSDGYVTVTSGQNTEVKCTNQQKKANITVNKQVVLSDGKTPVLDGHNFQTTLNSETKDFSEGNDAVFSVNPGTYGAEESAETNYQLVSNDGPVTVGSNGSATIHIVNKQNPGSVEGYKFQSDGQTPIAGWVIGLFSCATAYDNCDNFVSSTTTDGTGFYSFTDLLKGFYQIVENSVSGYTPVTPTFHNVTIDAEKNLLSSTDNNFNNFKNIDITVCKVNDTDGILSEFDKDQHSVSGWGMTLYSDGEQVGEPKTTGENGCTTFTNLGPDHDYSVTEESRDGWRNLPESPITHDFGKPEDGVNQSWTFFNQQLGKIIIQKVTNPSQSQQSFDFTLTGGESNLDQSFSLTDGTSHESGYVVPGSGYAASETVPTGWDQTSAICDNQSSVDNIQVDANQTVTCTFTNTQRGNVTVTKYNDADQNGSFDTENEAKLANWDIVLGESTQTTDESGATTFTNIKPGSYPLDEILKSGWLQTNIQCFYEDENPGEVVDGSYHVNVGAGDNINCFIGNFQKNPGISIVKTNDKGSGASAGDTVSYNLSVTNTGNMNLTNVKVTDSLPGGFSYVLGSSTLNGISVADPSINGNNLVWEVGNLAKGSADTITYKATIANNLTLGSYINVASCSADTQFNNEVILRINREFESDSISCDPATSTVSLGGSQSFGGRLVGQVLGASTELPGTGSPTALLAIALGLLTAGFILKKYAKN